MNGSSAATDKQLKEAIARLISGSMGVAALVTEVFSGAVKGRAAKGVATSIASRMIVKSAVIKLGGALLGVFMAVVEAYTFAGKAMSANDAGDEDAKSAYYAASFLAISSGMIGIPIAIIGAAQTIATAGATGTVAASCIPSSLSLLWKWLAVKRNSVPRSSACWGRTVVELRASTRCSGRCRPS